MTTVIFYISAVFIIFAALKMIFSKNLVHSVLFMAATFLGIALIYVLLQADYLAGIQIMIYVGAISILFVFSIMLTRRDSMDVSNPFNRYTLLGGVVAAAVFLLFGRILMMTQFISIEQVSEESTILPISNLLLNDLVLPFEISGLLLLISMIGAIIIGKGVKNPK